METENNNANQSSTPAPAAPQATPSSTPAPDTAPKPAVGDNKTLMGVLAYLGPLVIVPFLMAKDDPFVKFHIKQGLVLVVIELIVMVAGEMMYGLYGILGIVNIAALALSIIGIVNVIQGKEKELPVVGQFAKYFNGI